MESLVARKPRPGRILRYVLVELGSLADYGGDFRLGEQVSLRLSRTSVRLGDSVIVDTVLKRMPSTDQAGLRREIADPQGRKQEIVLSQITRRELRYRSTFEPSETGVYRVTLFSPGLTPAKQV